MAEISQFLRANSSLLYNWVVPWKYYLIALVCCKENQVFKIIMKRESTEFINLALCVSMHQCPESCVLWSPSTERYNRLGDVQ